MPKAKTAVPLKVFGKGGKTTLKRYGKAHFAKLAKKMHAKRKKAKATAKKSK